MPKALKIILYPAVFVVSLALFFVILFPYDSVKSRVARELEGALGGGYQITIGSLTPSPIAGAVLKNVEIRPRGAKVAVPIKISQAKLVFAVLPLLAGTVEVDFDIRTSPLEMSGAGRPAQGRAQGSLALKRGGMAIDVKMDRFDLALASFLTQKAGIPISGLVSGTATLEIYPNDPLRNAGGVTLQILDLSLGEISIANGTFIIPPLRLAQAGGSRLEVVVKRGNIEVKALQFAGGDVGLDTAGKIYGARKAANYRFNLKGSLRVSQAVADKLQILSLVEKQKNPDGAYPFTITGRVTKPSIRIGDFKLPI